MDPRAQEKTYLVGKIFSRISQTFIAINFVFFPKNFHFLSGFSHFLSLKNFKIFIFVRNSRLSNFSKIFKFFRFFKNFYFRGFGKEPDIKLGYSKKWNNGEPDTRYNNNGSQVQERFVRSASELSLYIRLRKSYSKPKNSLRIFCRSLAGSDSVGSENSRTYGVPS